MSQSFQSSSFLKFVSRLAAVPLAVLILAAAGCSTTSYETSEVAGARLFKAGDYTQAAGAYRNIIRSDPRDFESYYYLGVCYESMKAYQQAIQAYKTGLDVQPLTYAGQQDEKQFHLKLLDGLASAVAKSESRDATLDELQAKAQKTQSAWDYFLLAKISRDSGDADAALDQYNHAALLANKNFAILKEYGLYLQQLNQTARARQVLWQAGAIDQQDKEVASALRQLGVVPGPSLQDKSDLAKPVIPVGPIPPFNEIIGRNHTGSPRPAPAVVSPTDNTVPAASLQVPRE